MSNYTNNEKMLSFTGITDDEPDTSERIIFLPDGRAVSVKETITLLDLRRATVTDKAIGDLNNRSEALSTTSTTATNSETMNEQTDIAQLLNGKVVSRFGSTDGKTSISEDTISLPDGRTVTVREVTDLTQRKEPTDFGTTASNTSRVSGNTTATNN